MDDGAARTASQGDDCHVMVVDDEADFRNTVALLLGLEGFRVSHAATGTEALACVSAGAKPHLMLLDQRMPGLTGTQTLAELRRLGVDVPVVLVSAMADARRLAEEHRFDGVLQKPFSHDDLNLVIRAILRDRGAHCAQAT
jgi:CheY-like chemotaxis protein